VYLDPPYAQPLDEVIDAIREADAIVLGPGSLYTSIMPNLLVQRIAHEIEASNAVKIYVCNVMTQPGETVDYTAAKHVEALIANAKARVCDIVIVNDELPRKLLDVYAVERQLPVVVDKTRLDRLGVQTVRAAVISETETVRHDPEKLAAVVIGVIDQQIAQRASYVKFKPGAGRRRAQSAAAARISAGPSRIARSRPASPEISAMHATPRVCSSAAAAGSTLPPIAIASTPAAAASAATPADDFARKRLRVDAPLAGDAERRTREGIRKLRCAGHKVEARHQPRAREGGETPPPVLRQRPHPEGRADRAR